MNLWLRLLWTALCGWFGRRLDLPGEPSRLTFRVWFHDLDPFRHMNNGRYLTLMDLGRTDLMVRSGLARAAFAHKWTPIASAVVIRFRREMRLFQKFHLITRIVWWDERQSVIEQAFVLVGGKHDGQVAAHAMFKGGLYDRGAKAFVPAARLMQEAGFSVQSPPMSEAVAAYLAADEAMKRSGAQP